MATTKVIPPQVASAIARDDRFALILMGRAGGRKAARNRDVRNAVEEVYAERRDLEFAQRALEAHEDICPVDD